MDKNPRRHEQVFGFPLARKKNLTFKEFTKHLFLQFLVISDHYNRNRFHNGLKTGIKRTPIFGLAIAVITLSDSIFPAICN